jgi:hypothetical protein
MYVIQVSILKLMDQISVCMLSVHKRDYCRENEFWKLYFYNAAQVGPCHHSTARPQVADGGTASDKKGSYEYIE